MLGGGRRRGSLATQLNVKRIDTIFREYGEKFTCRVISEDFSPIKPFGSDLISFALPPESDRFPRRTFQGDKNRTLPTDERQRLDYSLMKPLSSVWK